MRVRNWILQTSAIALLIGVGASEVAATSVAPREPLIEAIARGELALPTEIEIAVGPPLAKRFERRTIPLSKAEQDLLRRLVDAHKHNKPEPFREALGDGAIHIQQIALDGLPQGRISYGYEGAQLARDTARREDAAFVAGFLPEFLILGQTPLAPIESAWLSPRAELAQECMAFLLRVSRDPATVNTTLDHLVTCLSLRPTNGGLDELHEALEVRSELTLTPAQQEILTPVLRKEMQRWLDYKPSLTGSDAPSLGAAWLVTYVNDKQAGDLLYRAYDEAGRTDFVYRLARMKHPKALEASREVLARVDISFHHHPDYKAAGFLGDRSLVPYIERRMQEQGTNPVALKALLDIGDSTVIARRMELDLDNAAKMPALFAASADAWLQTNPPDPEKLRRWIKTLPPLARVHLLKTLARNGATDLYERIRSYLVKPTIPIKVQVQAMWALGAHLKQTGDPEALELVLERADAAFRTAIAQENPYLDIVDIYNVACGVLRDYGHRNEAITEHLRSWWSMIPTTTNAYRYAIVGVQGSIGDEQAIQFLAPLCRYPTGKSEYWQHGIREAARAATGRIEAGIETATQTEKR